jgi:A/G-specific adenine glycosylase
LETSRVPKSNIAAERATPASRYQISDAHQSASPYAQAHELLLDWYAREGRSHLPWRETRDPYAILVAEVMLQQTQVERVLPKYAEWMTCFPTLEALAEAPVGDAIKAWAGLGYNSRAVRLHAIARQAVTELGGKLPETLEGLMALKGIGRYTAGAVACFAYELPVATVDTNIRRVLWRLFRDIEPVPWPSGEAASREIFTLAEEALPPDHAYDWQQALMDLGATVCLARRPLCEQCPVASCCAALQETAGKTLFASGEALARIRDDRAATRATDRVDESRSDGRRVAEARASYDAKPANSRRKPGYTRESELPFEQTSRYFRGRLVDALRSLPSSGSLPLAELGPRIKPDYTHADLPWLRALVHGLARDGLARTVAGDNESERVALP